MKHALRNFLTTLSLAVLSTLATSASAATLQVGPGKPFAAPCAAIASAAAGDTIQIDSSVTYSGDVCAWTTNNLTIIGVGSGRAVLNAAGQNSQGKAIWVISGNNTVIENIEFTGATVPDMNGAGIRAQGTNLTIRNCYFHDNQDGILTDGGNSVITIEFSEFFHNGAGDGFSHNLYIGNITQLIFRYNYSHGAVIGHLLKSRAAENDIYYNRLSDESTGTASYEIDLPNGGKSFIVGNLVEKGPQAQNSALVSYQEEGAATGNPDHELFVVNNTMVNDLGKGTFVVVDGSVTVPAVIKNNIFQGTGSITTQSTAIQANNFAGNANLASPSTFDYHLLSTSPAINAGADPGTGAGVSLTPVFQYVHPSCAEGRTAVGSAIDIGAYEFNGGNGIPPANAPSRCGTASPPPPAPTASLSPTSLTFTAQTLSTTSAAQTVTLANSGSAALTISSITIGGTNPGDFAQSANACTASLAAGSNCKISITFTPTATGTRSATLSFADNAAGSPQSVTLSGTGAASAAPSVALSPATLTFASQALNTTSAAQPVSLTNSGSAVLNISGISASGDFAQTNGCAATLTAGSSCTINVKFTPTAGGTRTGAIGIADDAPNSPQKITLTGTSPAPAPSASLSPSTLTFPAALVGVASSAQPITLKNSGSGPLAISQASVTGDFSQTNSCGASLAPSASCTINVTFKPTTGGIRSGTLSIADNATGSPQTAALSGAGMDFALSASPAFATISAGQAVNFTLAASPDGGFNKSIALTCMGAPAAATCSVTPSTVTLNGSAVSSVTVSIATTARSSDVPFLPGFQSPPAFPALGALAMLRLALSTLLAILLFLVARRDRRRMGLALCSLGVVGVFVGGCAGLVSGKSSPPPSGGIGSGTPAGSSVITVTGASGSLTHSATFTIKVN